MLTPTQGKLSYNFLLSRHWMLIVIRAAEKCGNISVNSLGFSGTILVKSEAMYDELRTTSPLAVLQYEFVERLRGCGVCVCVV